MQEGTGIICDLVMEKDAENQLITVVCPGSPMWCTFRMQLIITEVK